MVKHNDEEWTLPRLREMEKDELVFLDEKAVVLLEAGRPFLRQVCKAFDLHLLRNERQSCPTPGQRFSNAI